jgi:hypothetical protein
MMYYFTWHSPVHDGKLSVSHARHSIRVPNVDLATAMTGGRQDRYALQDRMSAAWTDLRARAIRTRKDLFPTGPHSTRLSDRRW